MRNRLEIYDFLIIFFAGSFLTALGQSLLHSAGLLPAQGSTAALFTSLWLQEAVLLLAVAFFLKLRQTSISDIGIRLPEQARTYAEAVVLGTAVYMLMNLLVVLIDTLWPGGLNDQNVQVYMHPQDSPLHIALIVLTMCVLAPITEEIVYRGYLFTSILRRSTPTMAMLLTSFFFACVHFDEQRFIPLFIGGFILNYFAWKKQSVLASAIVHGIWNFGSIASFYILS